MNPLQELHKFGQSPWLDYIRRNQFASGELKRLINNDGISGVTSNPSIFEKAIAGSDDYHEAIMEFSGQKELSAKDIFESLEIFDIQQAADALRHIYDETHSRDGYVSMEVSPRLSSDKQGTLEEARRLWSSVNRPNLMVKVPATPEGIGAIETLISEGINVNVTLLFSQDIYKRVVEAYIKGLELRVANGGDISAIASVASLFISRIDALVDDLLDKRIEEVTDAKETKRYESIKGKVAIANSRICYEEYKNFFSGARWDALVSKGAQTQRLLWASTSTKNPSYEDTLYMNELIGPDTVNTIPPATMDAFRDHGKVRYSLEEDTEQSYSVFKILSDSGISMQEVTDKLLEDGLKQFVIAFDNLLHAVESARS